jgi:PKD repeat protein
MDGYYAVSGPGYYDSGTFSLSKVVYTITATAGAGGTIVPSGSESVDAGASQLFTITANVGYSVLDVKVDGASVGAVTGYTFTNVQTNHTISATFYAVAPVASFTANPTSGKKPLEVSFSSTSSGAVTSRSWNFGDGSTSTASNPTHTYWRPGAYTVSLTVNGPGGSDVETKVDYITVEPGRAMPWLPLLLED